MVSNDRVIKLSEKQRRKCAKQNSKTKSQKKKRIIESFKILQTTQKPIEDQNFTSCNESETKVCDESTASMSAKQRRKKNTKREKKSKQQNEQYFSDEVYKSTDIKSSKNSTNFGTEKYVLSESKTFEYLSGYPPIKKKKLEILTKYFNERLSEYFIDKLQTSSQKKITTYERPIQHPIHEIKNLTGEKTKPIEYPVYEVQNLSKENLSDYKRSVEYPIFDVQNSSAEKTSKYSTCNNNITVEKNKNTSGYQKSLEYPIYDVQVSSNGRIVKYERSVEYPIFDVQNSGTGKTSKYSTCDDNKTDEKNKNTSGYQNSLEYPIYDVQVSSKEKILKYAGSVEYPMFDVQNSGAEKTSKYSTCNDNQTDEKNQNTSGYQNSLEYPIYDVQVSRSVEYPMFDVQNSGAGKTSKYSTCNDNKTDEKNKNTSGYQNLLEYPIYDVQVSSKEKILKIKWEIRHHDRRNCKPKIVLFKAKQKLLYCLKSAIGTAMRKNFKGDNLRVKDVKGEENRQRLCDNNAAYQFLRNIRTSPGYAEKRGKHALAMVRQLGLPHLFVTLGPNEFFSPELLLQLAINEARTTNKPPIVETLVDALNLSQAEKSRLIKNDPVLCAEFHNRARAFYSYIFINVLIHVIKGGINRNANLIFQIDAEGIYFQNLEIIVQRFGAYNSFTPEELEEKKEQYDIDREEYELEQVDVPLVLQKSNIKATLSLNGGEDESNFNIVPARCRAPSLGIDIDMVSEFDPSSSDSGVVSRCAVVKPLKLRLCRPIFGRKAVEKIKRDPSNNVGIVGKCDISTPIEIKPVKPRDPEREKRRIARKKEKRATLILGLIMGSFIACWLPFFFLYIIKPLIPSLTIPAQAFVIAFWLGYINSALNPVIYTVFNKDFRRAFRRILYK
ncbi:hypothetical protein HCN44_010364 [Aphidius gifuensis]|uniref:G-protein coupled receptors family 1 profile domain-containing protein n=1 Tax=Aphidius gifuensis TaxID=684658 RepID=A0A835CSB8_APHGI|nr:hypothetical protein HCN44_010364 [Aphidius gifuensis]